MGKPETSRILVRVSLLGTYSPNSYATTERRSTPTCFANSLLVHPFLLRTNVKRLGLKFRRDSRTSSSLDIDNDIWSLRDIWNPNSVSTDWNRAKYDSFRPSIHLTFYVHFDWTRQLTTHLVGGDIAMKQKYPCHLPVYIFQIIGAQS